MPTATENRRLLKRPECRILLRLRCRRSAERAAVSPVLNEWLQPLSGYHQVTGTVLALFPSTSRTCPILL